MLYFVFCQEDLLLQQQPDGTLAVPQADAPPTPVKPWTHLMAVTGPDGTPATAYSVDTPVITLAGHVMCPLRQSYYQLPRAHYLLAGKCRELLYWDQNTRHCGVCGAPMKMHTSISKRCTQCGKEVWPQLATAVIVLIRRADQVLLVQARNFRTDFYGLVAGFVETGETLEEAVARETLEETGISITHIKYFASQPWPYPCGLMVGFTADYAGGTLHLQQSEISRAGWFSRDALPRIPEKLSIARMLIDHWLKEQETAPEE